MQIAAPSFTSGAMVARLKQPSPSQSHVLRQTQFGCDSCGGAGGGGHLMHIIAGGAGLLTLASVLWVALRSKAKPKTSAQHLQPAQQPAQKPDVGATKTTPGEKSSGGKSE